MSKSSRFNILLLIRSRDGGPGLHDHGEEVGVHGVSYGSDRSPDKVHALKAAALRVRPSMTAIAHAGGGVRAMGPQLSGRDVPTGVDFGEACRQLPGRMVGPEQAQIDVR